MIEVCYKYNTGHLSRLETQLRRRVTGFAKWWARIKIGITNYPENRARQHYLNDPSWNKMIVLWETSSIKQVREAERRLTNWAWYCKGIKNEVSGGSGREGEKPYYLYILLSKKRSKPSPIYI